MTYLDSSVALAELLAEDRRPPSALWDESLVSSRLLEYEVWVRLHTLGFGDARAEPARELIGRVALLAMSAEVLERVLDPFAVRVRTLDAIHLASAAYLRDQGQSVRLATYDRRMADAALTLGIPLYRLDT